MEGDGLGSHDVGNGGMKEVGGVGKVAAEVAVGEDAEDGLVVVDDGDGAGAGFGHGDDGVLDGLMSEDACAAFAAAHDVGDFEEEGAADGAGGV